LLDCPVCLERLTSPKILPGCGHTLCESCTTGICRNPVWGYCHCPICRQRFRSQDVRPNYTVQALLAESDGQQPAAQVTSARLVRDVGAASLQAGRKKQLEFLGLPPKLAATVAEEDRSIGLRLFLLDNSGSTSAYDGKTFNASPDGSLVKRSCTRWEEIKQLALEHAEWNTRQGTPCEFILLNPRHSPPQSGVDFARVDAHNSDARPRIAALKQMLDNSGPGGPTPITARLQEIQRRVRAERSDLLAAGQRVVLVIATDGIPSSTWHHSNAKNELVQTLRTLLNELPLIVVLRLCTDDSDVVDFYNDVEKDLELFFDVLDDHLGEAREIAQQGNGWFTYSPELHRLREGGTFVKIFDLLDERRLTPAEASLLAQLLLRQDGQAPLPEDPEEFCEAVEALAPDAPLVLCARSGRLAMPVHPWGLQCAVLGFWSSWADELRSLFGLAMLGAGTACSSSRTLNERLVS